jgi:Tol biopolymer transport system component
LAINAPAATAAYPGANGKIALWAMDGSTGDARRIYSIGADGTDYTRLTAVPSYYPSWSPQGTRIALGAKVGSFGFQIAQMSASGSGPAAISQPPPPDNDDLSPSWSPDESQLVFARLTPTPTRGPVRELYVINTDGSGERRLPITPGLSSAPAWSPVAQRIVFAREPDSFSIEPTGIWAINADGTGLTQLRTAGISPDWSPDGTKIVFETGAEIQIMNSDGTTPVPVPNTNGATSPAYSPDGRKITFVRGGDVHTINADGTGLTNVTQGQAQFPNAPDWQPVQPPAGPYVRPAGATPIKVPLVPAYQACTAPNRVHGSPLSFPACDPPSAESAAVTVGTLEVNGADANSLGALRLRVQAGDPAPPHDSDVLVDGSISDVRCQPATTACGNPNTVAGADYTGQLQGNVIVRMTDRANSISGGGPQESATVVDVPFTFPFACTNTASAAEGGACSIGGTSINALIPGTVKDSQRAVWQVGQVYVTDGGTDGQTETTPNTFFMRQGLFVP